MELVTVCFDVFSALWALSFIQTTIFLGMITLLVFLCTPDSEEYIVGFLALSAIFVGLAGWTFWAPLLVWINSAGFVWFLTEYLFVGLLYMTFRWWVFSRDKAKDIVGRKDFLEKEYAKRYLSEENLTFREWLEKYSFLPVVSKNKYRLFNWWFVWPLSLVRWALTDMVRHIADTLVALIGDVFTKIRDRVLVSFGLTDDILNKKTDITDKAK